MPLETYPFDPARYLETAEDRAVYLEVALKTEDPAFIADAIQVIVRPRLPT